jgi:hypothetical protein
MKGISLWERFKLLFVKKCVYIDLGQDYGCKTTMKYMNGKYYVLKVEYE